MSSANSHTLITSSGGNGGDGRDHHGDRGRGGRGGRGGGNGITKRCRNRCLHCNKRGHSTKDCIYLIRVAALGVQALMARRGGGSSGRGGRGRGRGRGRGGHQGGHVPDQARQPVAEPQLSALDLLSLAEAHAQQPSPNGPNQPAVQQPDLAQLARALLALSNDQRETIGQLM
ncbi:hypothetical protein V8E54_000560 [Elaphomyces granulatus]